MSNTIFTGIVATASLWARLNKLLSNPELAFSRLVIESEEPNRLLNLPASSLELWDSYLSPIESDLLVNAGVPKSSLSQFSRHSFPWLKSRNLSSSELSVYHKHLQIYKYLANSNFDYALILEDDCLVQTGFSKLVSHLTQSYEYDYVDLANGISNVSQPPSAKALPFDNTIIYPALTCSTRTLCAYLVSRRLATSFVYTLYRHYVLPVDWMLSLVMRTSSYTPSVLWCDSPFFSHGSKSGAFMSSVSSDL